MAIAPAAVADDAAAADVAVDSSEPRWHRLNVPDVARRLGTDATRGLTAAEGLR